MCLMFLAYYNKILRSLIKFSKRRRFCVQKPISIANQKNLQFGGKICWVVSTKVRIICPEVQQIFLLWTSYTWRWLRLTMRTNIPIPWCKWVKSTIILWSIRFISNLVHVWNIVFCNKIFLTFESFNHLSYAKKW